VHKLGNIFIVAVGEKGRSQEESMKGALVGFEGRLLQNLIF